MGIGLEGKDKAASSSHTHKGLFQTFMAKNLQNSITCACPLWPTPGTSVLLTGSATPIRPCRRLCSLGQEDMELLGTLQRAKTQMSRFTWKSFLSPMFLYSWLGIYDMFLSPIYQYDMDLHAPVSSTCSPMHVCHLCHFLLPDQSRKKPQISPGTCHPESRDPRHQKGTNSTQHWHAFCYDFSILRVPC